MDLTVFRLRTLGGLALERDGVVLDTVGAQRKTLALLTLLAASRGRGMSRDRVAAYLWPESDTEHARGALKQVLHLARRQLGSPEAVLGTSELRLNSSYVDSDIEAYLNALDARELGLAVDLYGGPFLDGFHLPGSLEFEQWASLQRDELARRYASALDGIASAAEERGDWDAAIEWLRRLDTFDPFSARTTVRLMRALDAAGERVAALRRAQVHETLLREELDSPPDAEVAAFAARLATEGTRPIPLRDSQPPGSATPRTTALAAAASQAPPATVPIVGSRPPIRRGHIAAAVAAVTVVVLAAIFLFPDRRRPQDAPVALVTADRSVAVLPFANVSGDLAIDHLAAALTDELTSGLARVGALRVAPPTVALALHREGLDRNAIADSLGVAAVVEGTVRRVGDHIQVSARLVSVREQAILWSQAYDRDVGDLGAVQAEIAGAVIGALHPQWTPSTAMPLGAPRTTVDEVAYDLYLRGRHSWRQRTREGIQQAVVFLEGAIERDPSFALAYAGLAATYVNCSNFGYCDMREALAKAGVAADRALALDAGVAEAHAAKGFVLASRLEFEAAEAAFQRAIELNRSLTWAHHYYSLLLLMLGRTDEALAQNGHALTVDPLSLPANATRGIILLQRGDLTGAERELERALALSPGFHLTLYYLGVVRAAQGRYDGAGQLLERAGIASPDFTGVPGARAFVMRQTGRQREADSLLAGVEALTRTGNERARMNLAAAHAALGRPDAAFALFDRVEWDVPSLIELRADPLLRTLRSDPRYPALLEKIGADRQAK